MDKNIFPKGAYVVLLSTCSGEDGIWLPGIPVNYVYKLRIKSNTAYFSVVRDTFSREDSWDGHPLNNTNNKLSLRAATEQEIEAYNRKGGPVPAITEPYYNIY